MNQSLLGATENKISLPISNLFFFKKGIILLSETLGANVDSTIIIGGFWILYFLISIILLKTFNNGL